MIATIAMTLLLHATSLDDSLARLRATAKAEHSDALYVFHDGRLLVEQLTRVGADRLSAQSISKSVAALAIMKLVSDGKIASLDDTADRYIGVWKELSPRDPRREITVRQLMSHTSGLKVSRWMWEGESVEGWAGAGPLVHKPGTTFRYSNHAVELLALVVKGAAGESFQHYVQRNIFEPLDIRDAEWHSDRQGTADAATGLNIRARDLAKVGELMLGAGTWRGKRLIEPKHIDVLSKPSQAHDASCGLLWWIVGGSRCEVAESTLDEWRRDAVESTLVNASAKLIGLSAIDPERLSATMAKRLGPPLADKLFRALSTNRTPACTVRAEGPAVGIMAAGSLGQYLVVIPNKRLVAVRMRAATERDDAIFGKQTHGPYPDTWPDFWQDIASLPVPSNQ